MTLGCRSNSELALLGRKKQHISREQHIFLLLNFHMFFFVLPSEFLELVTKKAVRWMLEI